MLSAVDAFMCFFAGFNFGLVVGTVFFYSKIKNSMLDFYSRERVTPTKQALPPIPPSSTVADDSITQRLNKASELTRLQNEIVSQAQQPSQNSIHSKHKNGLIQQYKALEVEKMGLLQSIIKEGHDPLVTVFNATSKQNEEVKLSTFLSQFAPNVPAAANTDPNSLPEGEGIRKVTKKGKTFYVIDGGKKTTQ